MRLTTLGGSAAGPNPGQGCSGSLVEIGSTRVVLDLGPGTLPELRRHADYRTVDAVVISHLHVDHVLDVLALRYALAYNPIPPPHPVPLWMPPGGRGFLDRVALAFAGSDGATLFFDEVFEVAEYDPERTLDLGGARLRFAPTVHPAPCWAIRVDGTNGEAGVGYTADTGPAADLVPLLAGAAILLSEATSPPMPADHAAGRGHLTPSEAATLAAAANVSTLVLTHLWEENGIERAVSEAAAVFSGRIEVARPGLSFAW